MSKYRVIKLWEPNTASFTYHVQVQYIKPGWWRNELAWRTIAWDLSEETAKKNAKRYNVKIKEVDNFWDA